MASRLREEIRASYAVEKRIEMVQGEEEILPDCWEQIGSVDAGTLS